jgi:hypothetical protein
MENKIPKIMEDMSKSFKTFSGTGSIDNTVFPLLTPNGISSITTLGMLGNTSTPELIDVIVTEDTIEHVYKRIMYNPMGVFDKTQVFKKIYGRKDGSEKEVFGEYTPAQPESYYF